MAGDVEVPDWKHINRLESAVLKYNVMLMTYVPLGRLNNPDPRVYVKLVILLEVTESKYTRFHVYPDTKEATA